MDEYNKMIYEVYKNNTLINSNTLISKGLCDRNRVQTELINDFAANLFYKTCKIEEIYYKKIRVTWYTTIGTDQYKTVRIYEKEEVK